MNDKMTSYWLDASYPIPEDMPSPAATTESHYFNILRIALAIAIIRTKPEHMTATVYTQLKSSKLIENEKSWKLKAEKLQKELLLVQEELLQVKFSVHNLPLSTPEEASPSIKSPHGSGEPELNTMDCLTPPCSSESTSSEHHNTTVARNKHTAFLRSIIALREAPQTAAMLENDDLCLFFTSTVLQAVSVLRESIHDECFVETSIPECCVTSLLGVLDMRIPSPNASEVTDKVLDFAEEIIQATINCEPDENNALQEKYSKLISRLACHNKTTDLILSKLVDELKRFSVMLRAISQEPVMLAEKLGKYRSIYYILWCIENILSQTLEYGFTESVSSSIMESLEDSVLHLTKTFPLFAHWVWRIGRLLSSNRKRKIETN